MTNLEKWSIVFIFDLVRDWVGTDSNAYALRKRLVFGETQAETCPKSFFIQIYHICHTLQKMRRKKINPVETY